MELWVILSIGAAFTQNLRSAFQKALTPHVGVTAATCARFMFALPLALALFLWLVVTTEGDLPQVTTAFFLWSLGGAVAQVVATLLLLHLFTMRNFAVGNTFAKSETLQAALVGFLLLGDVLGLWPIAGIGISLVGIWLLSTTGFGKGLWNSTAGIGLACGLGFAVSGVCYRAGGLALEGDISTLARATWGLTFVILLQTLVLTLWLRAKRPGAVTALFVHWRVAVPVGLAGMATSLQLFAALTLVTAAHVKAVGQIELILSWLTSWLIFREKPSLRDTLGMVLVAAGIIALVLTT
jgi:drug/metabolite transporter (DMT)-like permease